MSKLISKGLLALAALGCAVAAHGFSLLGPFEAWQAPALGYNPGANSRTYDPIGDAGAPKNIGGEYRLVEPILVYGFEDSFVNYFGEDGVQAVEAAFKVFNDLPPVSEFSSDLSEFPLSASRVNFTAQRLGVIDVKSVVMSWICENLGLASPERYVWTIRQINPDLLGNPQFLTTRRNFDPVTQLASSYVNNSLYTYYIRPFFASDGATVLYYDANEVALDAAEPNVSLAAYLGTQVPTVDGRVENRVSRATFGTYYTGLTRDDAGGLRYIYHPNNKNYQPLPGGTTLRTSGNFTVIGTGSGGGWTGLTPAIGNASGGTTNVAAPINLGVRAGLNRINFIRADTDPLLNRFLKPVVIRYSDTVMTNGVTRQQQVERTFTLPNLQFTADDFGARPGPETPFPWIYARGDGNLLYVSSPQQPGESGGIKDPNAGPGIVDFGDNAGGSIIPLLVFNTAGGGYVHGVGNIREETGTKTFLWGSFDGTTNAPIVYPKGQVTLQELESGLRGGR